MSYRIGEVCRMLEIDTTTLRNWERMGRVPRATRTPMGFRSYTEDNLAELRRIVEDVRQQRSVR
jgi:DNA-binding transcriptional MerR regulator